MMPAKSVSNPVNTDSFRKAHRIACSALIKSVIKRRLINVEDKTYILLNAYLPNYHLKNADNHLATMWLAIPNRDYFVHALRLVMHEEIPFNGINAKGTLITHWVPNTTWINKEHESLNEELAIKQGVLIQSHVLLVDEIQPACLFEVNSDIEFLDGGSDVHRNHIAFYHTNEIGGYAFKESLTVGEQATQVVGRLHNGLSIQMDFRDKRATAIQKEGCDEFYFNGSLRLDYKRSKGNASWFSISVRNFESAGLKAKPVDIPAQPTNTPYRIQTASIKRSVKQSNN